MRSAVRLLSSMEASSDPGDWVEKNRQFHAALESAAEAPRLAAFVKSVQDSAAVRMQFMLFTSTHV